MKNIVTIVLLTIGVLFSSRPLSFKPFDFNSTNQIYGRGDYLIVLADSYLESYLENEIHLQP